MIEKTTSYKCGDKFCATLEEAQQYELQEILKPCAFESGVSIGLEDAAIALVEHADKVIDILTTTAKSRARARRANGGTKTRKAKPAVVNGATERGFATPEMEKA